MDSPLKPILPTLPGESCAWSGLAGSGRGLAIAAAAENRSGPLLVITGNSFTAQRLEDEIRFYAAELPILPLPDWESLPYDAFSPHQDIISQRLETLYRLPNLKRGVVLASVTTLLHRLPPRDYVSGHSFLLKLGDRLDIQQLREQLVHANYHNVSQVMEAGEFAIRGGLIDLYPAGSHQPYRIDLFGEQVESIREFDPATQRSGKTMNSIQLLPAREFPMTEDAIQKFRQAFRARFEGDPQKVPLYRDISKGISPSGAEYYLPLFFPNMATIFDYLPADTLCIMESNAAETAEKFQAETAQRYQEMRHDIERPLLSPAEVFITKDEFIAGLKSWPQVEMLEFTTEEISREEQKQENRKTVAYDTRPPASLPVDHKSDAPYAALFRYLHDFPGRILVVAESAGRRETLKGLLQEHRHPPDDVSGWNTFLQGNAKLGLAVADLEKGLLLREPGIAVITEAQLYGERAAQRRRRARGEREPEAIIRSLAELKIGDPVVHEDHGVGRYLGLQTLDIGDGPAEFLTLEYADGDKLYIPVLSLHLISRYTGTDPEQAPLHKLGGEAWEKAKRRALEKAHDAAAELLEIYALRAAREGHAFPLPDEHYQSFAGAFPFEETPDQERAIQEVLQDMQTAKPMDRLVCGDVGFGKTEVAIRAAFLAVMGKAQVAVLVPTTLLAQQHFQNFQDRFAGLPFRIELLSRFRSAADQRKTLTALADGSVDIVIGTHRLLQEDVRFKRLGLVIIDEEHRFGVRQKERLKKLRSEADILAMTATPIPRTLNLSLSGLRDISLITTAPEGRLSVKTFISEVNRSVIREACLREIRRGGQVYYLHNEVRTIDKAARELQELMPEADIRIAHGQMPERELERIMLDFYHQRFNILVCSTIIESGIDVPTANTIIIERADKFGLAQLHQLRGRVGRSHHRAYAYLLVPDRRALTEDARKRLEAIESMEELGAGFTLASHDLEIRGAGELLGETQSGMIDEVGFTLYSELLNRAVRSLQAGRLPETDTSLHSGTEINLHAPALFPENYLPDVHMRLILYKRIASVKTLAALQELMEEIIDRFGVLPEAGKLLFRATELKILTTPLGIRKIDAGPRGARVEFIDKPDVDSTAILRLLQSAPKTYKLDGPNRLRILGDMPEVDARIKAIRRFLEALAPEVKAASSR
ncbi:MAG: transcription-repair coupling factor [Gammaproteobacteria bacterium]|nr:transcription-repair coupling factor [Gammaproteobacteria bacterium]